MVNERSLHEQWVLRRGSLVADAQAAARLARAANGQGEHLLAIEVAETVLQACSAADASPLLLQKALGLARSGSTHAALQVLEQLHGAAPGAVETLGLLGRVHKDLAAAAAEPSERTRLLGEARAFYRSGYEHARATGDVGGALYCGINAAAQAALLDDGDDAEALARALLALPGDDADYWSMATRAEACLILQRKEEAAALYRRACELARGRWADIASTKRQARLLSLKLYGTSNELDAAFPAGRIAIFAGPPAAPGPGGSDAPQMERAWRSRMAAWLDAQAVRLSFSSAAAGADVVFLAAAQEAGVETHVVLPHAVADFIETGVRPYGEGWLERFQRVMAGVASTTILNDQAADDRSRIVEFLHRMIAAKAALRAAAVDLPVAALAVWDGRHDDDGGGTGAAVSTWSRAKIPVTALHPTNPEHDGPVHEEIGVAPIPFDRTQAAQPQDCRTVVCSILHLYFADYYGLRDDQYRSFQQTVLGSLASTLAATSYPPVSRYGLGPDYIFVFDAVRPAALFALEVMQTLADGRGASADLAIEPCRFCLHAGPVQLMINPVLNQYAHEGATLTRAGRIVRRLAAAVPYCTEPFASLAALESLRELRFEYVGTATYGPDAGQDRLFSVHFT